MKHSGLDNINQPAYDAAVKEVKGIASIKLNTTDVTNLTNKELNSLKAGDIVVKKTGNELHTYIVSYKGEGSGTGICLTYTDAGYMETVSYDRSGDGWVYNSTDVCNINDIPNVEDAPSGTIVDALGLNSYGKLVKGSIGGGTKLYKHGITLNGLPGSLIIVSLSNQTYASLPSMSYNVLSAEFSGPNSIRVVIVTDAVNKTITGFKDDGTITSLSFTSFGSDNVTPL